MGIWVVPVAGGPLRKLHENAFGAALSPDGSQIAFRRGAGEIWLAEVAGGEPRNLLSAPSGYSFIEALGWSPDGRRIAFGRRSEAGDEFAIECHDLSSGQTSVILSDPKAGAFCWARDGRIIYARLEGLPSEKESNLWDIRVDARTGQIRGKPRRLTNWSGFLFDELSTSSDGSRLFSITMRHRSDVYLAELKGKSSQWTTPRRLTFEHWLNRPTGWTRDSQAVLFSSERNGNLDIFQQGVKAPAAQVIVTDPEEKWEPRPSADGRWILYLAWPTEGERVRAGEGRLMRVGTGGGSPQVLFRVAGYMGSARIDPPVRVTAKGHTRFRCPSVPHSPCVLSEQVQNRVVFTAFDPVEGRKGKLAEVDVKDINFWDLSPDGRWIALGKTEWPEGRIRLLSLAGQAPREISAGGWPLLESVAWAADGKALFVTTFASQGAPLLRLSLEGKVQFLHRGAKYLESPVASPDGRYLAFAENTAESNAWVIESVR